MLLRNEPISSDEFLIIFLHLTQVSSHVRECDLFTFYHCLRLELRFTHSKIVSEYDQEM